MYRFYFENKKNHYAFSGISPHKDNDWPPLDYFIYLHATSIAELWMGIDRRFGMNLLDSLYYNKALKSTIEETEKILSSTLPPFKFQQILAHEELTKKQQENLWRNTIVSSSDILWFNYLAQCAGFLVDVDRVEYHPEKFNLRQVPKCYSQKEDQSIEAVGNTNMSDGELRALLVERKAIQTRIYHKGDSWHCFYYTYRGLSGNEAGENGGRPHYHYISNKWGYSLDTIKSCIDIGQMPPSKVHVFIKKDINSIVGQRFLYHANK